MTGAEAPPCLPVHSAGRSPYDGRLTPPEHHQDEGKQPCDNNDSGEDGGRRHEEARRKLSEATAGELRNLVAAAVDRMKGAWDETKAENFANIVLERLGMEDEDVALPTPFDLTLLCTGEMLAEHGTGSGGSTCGDGVDGELPASADARDRPRSEGYAGSSIGLEGVQPAPATPLLVGVGREAPPARGIPGALPTIYWYWMVVVPLRSTLAAGTIAMVGLGDGTTRVGAGERVRCRNGDNNMDASARTLRWREWPDGVLNGGLFDGENKRPLPEVRSSMPPSDLARRRPMNDGRDCFFVKCRVNRHDGWHLTLNVEERHIDVSSSAAGMPDWGESVVVLEEGLALPTRVLLDLVNTVYAVLVLRGDTYHYLHNDFALSAEEEESLVEWGVGRRAFAGILVAVGGLMLVLFSDVWRPAAVGTLLVAAAAYRIQGALTALIRVCLGGGWKNQCRLIPSGVHGTERFMQFVLVTTLAVSEVLDSRVLLLIGLSLATLQVVLLEVAGQIVITWGLKRYLSAVFLQLFSCAMAILSCASLASFGYFCGRFSLVMLLVLILILCVSVGVPSARSCIAGVFKKLIGRDYVAVGLLLLFLWVGMIADLVMMTNDAADERRVGFYAPWKWPLTQAPDGFWSAMRLILLWLLALGYILCAAFVTISMFSFKVGSDRGVDVFGVRGERSLRRKERREFASFSESSIPSRHVFHDVAVEGCDTAV